VSGDFAFETHQFFLALRCFACDSEADDGLCVNSPSTVTGGNVRCGENDPDADDADFFCYTYRLEQQLDTVRSE